MNAAGLCKGVDGFRCFILSNRFILSYLNPRFVCLLSQTATLSMFSLPRLLYRSSSSRVFSMSAAPTFKPFTLALVQLGQIGSDKAG